MKAFALACLLAAPVLSKALAQQYDDAYAEEPVAEEPAYDAYEAESVSAGSTYSVSDHDQYHNNEDNNQSPYVTQAKDTTTQNVNFRINLLKNGGNGKGKGKKAAYWTHYRKIDLYPILIYENKS